MIFYETKELSKNVLNNNNIAQKNIVIINLEPNTGGMAYDKWRCCD